MTVINDAISAAEATFRQYANEVREAQAVKAAAFGLGNGGGVLWWRNIDKRVKCFLLSAIVEDDWERYIDVPWPALPPELRSNISSQSRSLERMV